LTTPTEDDTPPAGTTDRPSRELEAPDHLDRDTGPRPAAPGRRRLPWLVPLLTALIGLAVGLGIGLGWGRWWQPQPAVIATAVLHAADDWPTASGNATVEVTPQGERYLIVQAATPPPRDGYRQAWLVTKDGHGRYPVGAMIGDERRFPLPPSLDLEVYSTLEVSYQLIDEPAGETGDIMLRGELS